MTPDMTCVLKRGKAVEQMALKIPGIHHVTSIVGDPQRNVDFYTEVLGLRPLKVTVNFDVPNTYHLYFGDQPGTPGTILTTFPWPHMASGRIGAGQVGVTSFAIPDDAIGYWVDRLKQHGVAVQGPERRFDDEVVTFADPDGLVNQLVSRSGTSPGESWRDGPVPRERAIAGFSGVTLLSRHPERTASLLTELLGFQAVAERDGVRRFVAIHDQLGSTVDLFIQPPDMDGTEGPGTVHHVAWRTRDEGEQQEWSTLLTSSGLSVTPVRDRSYFKSIYFNEPGGILFEIATDPPGFAIDEPAESLASAVRLPPWYESRRAEFERGLQPIRLPNGVIVP
jgi:glyoxalase family protein